MSVVDLAAKRAEREREDWASGTARCLSCKHEWVAVAPHSTDWLECPICSLVRGRFVYHYVPRTEATRSCRCGNDLFTVTPSGVLCPACGSLQGFS